MTFLPVILRELQVQARQPATNRLRWLAACSVMLLAGFFMSLDGNNPPQERARLIFVAMGIVCLGFGMLAGVFQTADCLSEERREGTLGLLFLTDLRGYDVVLGKLVSTSLQSFYTFLATLPVMALPLLLGGITAGEFWRVALVLVVTLYLSLSVGLLVSAVSREARLAALWTFLLILICAGVFPLIDLLAPLADGRLGFAWLLRLSPPFALLWAFDSYYSSGGGGARFWQCLGALALSGTLALTLASVLLPRRWQESDAGAGRPAAGRFNPFRLWQPRAAETGHLRGTRPYFWLVTRDRRPRQLALWSFIVLLPPWLYCFTHIWGPVVGRKQFMLFWTMLLLTYALHLLLKCFVAVEATRQFSEDRQSGALELLLVTPLSVAEIVASQQRGVWRSFRWAYALLTFLNGALFLGALGSEIFRQDREGMAMFSLLVLGGILLLYLDGYALVRVGMWQALTKRRQMRAVLGVLLRVLLPPWVAVLLFIFISASGASGGPEGMVFLWLFIGGMVDLLFIVPATHNLQDGFREVVSVGRYEPPLSSLTGAASQESPGLRDSARGVN